MLGYRFAGGFQLAVAQFQIFQRRDIAVADHPVPQIDLGGAGLDVEAVDAVDEHAAVEYPPTGRGGRFRRRRPGDRQEQRAEQNEDLYGRLEFFHDDGPELWCENFFISDDMTLI